MTRQRLRSTIAGLVLGVLAILLQPSGSCVLQAATVEPLRVLFIGNSYIYVNDLPSVLAELVLASHELRPGRERMPEKKELSCHEAEVHRHEHER